MPDSSTLESIREHPDMAGYRRQMAELMAAPDLSESEFTELGTLRRRVSGEAPPLPDRTAEWYHAMAALPGLLTDTINDALAPLGWQLADAPLIHHQGGPGRNRLGARCELELTPRPGICKFTIHGMRCTDEEDAEVNNGGYCIRHYAHVSAEARIENLFKRGVLHGTEWLEDSFTNVALDEENFRSDYSLDWKLLAWAFTDTGGDAERCTALYLSTWDVRYDADLCRDWYRRWHRLDDRTGG